MKTIFSRKPFFKFFKFYFLFIYFLAALGLRCCTRAFSSCSERGLLFVAVRGLLIAVASLVAEHGLQARGLQQLWLTGCRAQSQQLWLTGLVAPRHVGSSQTRARTRVPCIGRWILNHCTTREVPSRKPLSTSIPSHPFSNSGQQVTVVPVFLLQSVCLLHSSQNDLPKAQV